MQLVRLLLALASLAGVCGASAQQPTSEPITLQRAIELTLLHNAGLSAARREVEAAEAALGQAGVLPNPNLEFGLDNIGNSRKAQAGDRTASLQIGQLIELGGKRHVRVRLAQTGRDLADWELRARRAEVVARAKLSFHDVLASQERNGLAEDSLNIARRFVETVEKRVLAGKVSPVEETRAKLTLSQAFVEREQARRELSAARQRLAALWGESPPGFPRVDGNLDRLPALPDLQVLAERLHENPEYARWNSEIARRRAGIDAERAKAVPDVTLSGGVTRFSAFGDHAYMVGISIPLPVFDQNTGGILEARRRLDKAQDDQRAARQRLLAELADVYHRTAAIRVEVEALRVEILPGAQSAFDAAARGYQLGKFGFIDVLDAQRTLSSARMQHLRALADHQRGVTEIERLIGVAQ